MSVIKFTWKGSRSMRTKLRKIAVDMNKTAIPKAMNMQGELVLTDAKQNYVSVDKGSLRASGHRQPSKVMDFVHTVVLTFGGIAASYALAIHEHLSKHSPPSWKAASEVNFSPGGTGPKYLTLPLMAKARTMARDIARMLKF